MGIGWIGQGQLLRMSGVVLFLLGMAFPVWGHGLEISTATASLLEKGRFRIELKTDLVDYLQKRVEQDDPQQGTIDYLTRVSLPELTGYVDALSAHFLENIQVKGDGQVVAPENLEFPDIRQIKTMVRMHFMKEKGLLPSDARAGRKENTEAETEDWKLLVVVEGQFPNAIEKFSVRFPAEVGQVLLSVVEPRPNLVLAGQTSDAYTVATGPGGNSPLFHFWNTVSTYLVLGFEHILPKGLDHILFVLGLFLLSTRWKPLLWQITAFTVAHTCTLLLSMYGTVSLPSRYVEPVIALSIAFIAWENLRTSQLKVWRPFIVFGFGLIHGFGFAGVLQELGLPDEDYIAALLSFNVGVEFGQLATVGLAFLAIGWFRNASWYRGWITNPLSLLIGAIGLYWTVERIVT